METKTFIIIHFFLIQFKDEKIHQTISMSLYRKLISRLIFYAKEMFDIHYIEKIQKPFFSKHSLTTYLLNGILITQSFSSTGIKHSSSKIIVVI